MAGRGEVDAIDPERQKRVEYPLKSVLRVDIAEKVRMNPFRERFQDDDVERGIVEVVPDRVPPAVADRIKGTERRCGEITCEAFAAGLGRHAGSDRDRQFAGFVFFHGAGRGADPDVRVFDQQKLGGVLCRRPRGESVGDV